MGGLAKDDARAGGPKPWKPGHANHQEGLFAPSLHLKTDTLGNTPTVEEKLTFDDTRTKREARIPLRTDPPWTKHAEGMQGAAPPVDDPKRQGDALKIGCPQGNALAKAS